MKFRRPPSSRILLAALVLLLSSLATPGCTASAKKARFLSRAENYFKAGDYEKAKIEYLNLLRVDGQNLTAIQRLGVIWFEEGAPLRAFPYLLGSRQLAPENLEMRVKLGLAFLSVGQLAEARKEAVAILEKDPKNGEAALLLANSTINQEELSANEQILQKLPDQNNAWVLQAKATLAIRGQNLATAQSLLERAQTADPKLPTTHLGLAVLATARQDFTRAEQEFKTAVQLSPPRSPAVIKYADFKMGRGAIAEAKAILTEAARRAPDYLPAWQMQAQIANLERKYDDSLALLERIFSQDADNIDARLLQATNLLAKNDSAKAVEILEKLDGVYKTIPLIKFQLARAYLQANNRNGAVTILTQALTLAPDYAEATLMLSGLNIAGGEAQTAVNALTELLRKRPNLADAQLMLADAYRTLGRFDDSAALLNGLIKATSSNARAYLLLGIVQRQQNKPDEAKASLTKARELTPDDANILSQLIDIDLQQKDFAGALQKARDQVQKTPDSAAAHFLEARVYVAQSDWAHAEAALQKTLELDPNFSSAYDLLISTYLATNKLDSALGQLEKVLAKTPNNTSALMMTGLIYSQKKDPERARDAYEKLLAVDPNSTAALNNLAYLYSENLNQLDKAYELGRKARGLQPGDASVADTFGWILYKRADYPQALRLLQEAVAKLGEMPEVQFHFGMANYMMGQAEPAREALRKALASPTDFAGKTTAARRLASLGETGANVPTLSSADLETLLQQQPDDLFGWMQLGDLYTTQKDFPKAAAAFERALKLNPKLLAATMKLLQLNAGPLGNHARALELARKARELAPNDAAVTEMLGEQEFADGNFARAYTLLQERLREPGADARAQRNFAWAAYSLGKVSEAQEAMRQVLKMASDNSNSRETDEAKAFLMWTALTKSSPDLTAKRPEIEKSLQADPNYVPALMARAAAETQRGDKKVAVATLEVVLRRYPDFTPGQKELATLLADDPENQVKAYDLATKARKSLPTDSELAQTLAALCYQKKDYAYTIRLLQEVRREKPLNAKALFHLGMSYAQTKQEKLSREALEQSLTAGLDGEPATEAKRILAQNAAK